MHQIIHQNQRKMQNITLDHFKVVKIESIPDSSLFLAYRFIHLLPICLQNYNQLEFVMLSFQTMGFV